MSHPNSAQFPLGILSRHSDEHRRYARPKFRAAQHDSVIRVYDHAGNVIETHEHKGEFKE
jgi:hypothetical protein